MKPSHYPTGELILQERARPASPMLISLICMSIFQTHTGETHTQLKATILSGWSLWRIPGLTAAGHVLGLIAHWITAAYNGGVILLSHLTGSQSEACYTFYSYSRWWDTCLSSMLKYLLILCKIYALQRRYLSSNVLITDFRTLLAAAF